MAPAAGITAAALVAAAAFVRAAADSPGCPGTSSGWTNPPGSGYCFKPVNTTLSWSAAEAYCKGLTDNVGGLAAVRDAGDAAFVFGQRCGVGKGTRMATPDMWTGLTDSAVEAGSSRSCCWAWGSAGSAPTGYMLSPAGQAWWSSGEPNNANNAYQEDCVELFDNGALNDAACGGAFWFCCEAPLATPSATATASAAPSVSASASTAASGSSSPSLTASASSTVSAGAAASTTASPSGTPAATGTPSPSGLPPLWSPDRLRGQVAAGGGGLVAWLRADDLFAAPGGPLTVWPNAAAASPAESTTSAGLAAGLPQGGRAPYLEGAPSLTARTATGVGAAAAMPLRAVRFDALSGMDGQHLVVNASLAATASGGEFTVLFVARWTTAQQTQRLVAGAANNVALGAWMGSGGALLLDGDWGVGSTAVASNATGPSGWTLWTARAALPTGAVSLHRNGSLVGSKTATAAMRGPAGLRLGGGWGTGATGVGEYSSCAFAEVLVFNRSLPDYERTGMEGYLAWKWGLTDGLPAGHPYAWAGGSAPPPPALVTPSATPTSTASGTGTPTGTRTGTGTATGTRTSSPTPTSSVTASGTWSPAPGSCPGAGWFRPAGSNTCYRPLNASLTWAAAQAACVNISGGAGRGGGLAAVRNDAEAGFVFGQRCGAAWATATLWTALSDAANEATSSKTCCWTWAGAAVPEAVSTVYMFSSAGQAWWNSGEPNNTPQQAPGGEDCVEVIGSGKINDASCANTALACCEAPAATASPTMSLSPSTPASPPPSASASASGSLTPGGAPSGSPSPTGTGSRTPSGTPSPLPPVWAPERVPDLLVWLRPEDVQTTPSALAAWPNAAPGGDPAYDAVPQWGRAPWVEGTPSSGQGGGPAAAARGGFRAVRFDAPYAWDGANLVTNVTTPLYTNATGAFTILALARYTAGDWFRVLSGANNNFIVGGWNGGTGHLYLDGDWGVGGTGSTGTGPTGWTLWTASVALGASGTVALYRNGSLVGSKAATALMRGPAGLRLGGGYTPTGPSPQYGVSEFSNCAFAELLVFSRPLSDYERQGMEGFLAWKHNLTGALPSGHLFGGNNGATGGLPFMPTNTPTGTATRTGTPTGTPSRTPSTTGTASGTGTSSLTPGAPASVTPSGTPGLSALCPDASWYRPPNSSVCYKAITNASAAGGWTWAEAGVACRAAAPLYNGALAGLTGRPEGDYLGASRCGMGPGYPFASTIWVGVTSSAVTFSRTCCWLLSSSRDATWFRSAAADYTWASGEPNQSGNCLQMYTNNGLYDDTMCTDRKAHACCEVPLATPSPSPSITPSGSATGSATPPPTGTASPTASATPSKTGTPSPTASVSTSLTASASATGTPSASGSGTASASGTGTGSGSPSSAVTPTASGTGSSSASGTGSVSGSRTGTRSRSASGTGSRSRSADATATPTPSSAVTASVTPSAAATRSATVSPSRPASPSTAPRAMTTLTYSVTNGSTYAYWVVPPGVKVVTAHLWGAGGGGAGGGASSPAYGGAGAYITGALPVTGGQTLRVIIGRGGPWAGRHGTDAQGGGGGGWPTALTGDRYGGAGGGRSAVQVRNAAGTGWTEVATAGGGGGGGGYGQSGGAGGVLAGRRGGDQAATWAPLQNPATQYVSVWGGGGNRTGGGRGSYAGASGWAGNGGDADAGTRNACGGGGGGWFGGAAGDDGPGGGGSSYAGGLVNASGLDGVGPLAPASWLYGYVLGSGAGGAPQKGGGHGLVLLVLPAGYVPSVTPTPSRSASRSRPARPPTATLTATPSRSPSRSRTRKPKRRQLLA